MAYRTTVFLGTQMAVGGAQRMMLSLAAWLARRGFRVQALFFYDKEGLHDDWQAEYDFPIVNLDGWRSDQGAFRNLFRVIPAIWRLIRLLRAEKPGVLQTFTPHSDLLGLPVGWLAGVPVRIGNFQGIIQDMPEWQRNLHARMVNTRIFSQLVAVSNQMAVLAIENGVDPEKISVIPNAIHIPEDEDELQAQRPRLRDELGIGDDDVLALTVGRVTLEKGHIYLIRAIPEIIAQHPEIKFVFAGDGPERINLQHTVDRLEIGEHVLFLGTRRDVPALLRAADLFVLPSLSEGLPLALLEAMSARLPCIATLVQGSRDVIQPGVNGELVPAGNPLSLEKAIDEMMNKRSRWDEYRRQARKTVEDHYTIEKIGLRYEELFGLFLEEDA